MSGVEFASLNGHTFLKMNAGDYAIVVSTPRIADVRSSLDLRLIIVGLGLFSLLIGYAAVSWLFKPIRAIRDGTARIGRGNFDHRITNIRHDQLGDLAGDINQLAYNVESMLDAKRALLLGISHELRTPLSRLNLATEFIDNPSNRESIKAEIDEMEKIVGSLLEAERLNSRHARILRSDVKIAALINTLLDDYFARDRKRIQVELEDPAITAHIDEPRVSLMLKNLLSNALRYAPEDSGPVTLSVMTGPAELVLRVQDNGPGIPAEDAEHLGEPFYRGDPSRARETGGTGLGLYLATLVARAHGGILTLVEPDEPGTCFEVRLPV